jgi:hypothetical protein
MEAVKAGRPESSTGARPGPHFGLLWTRAILGPWLWLQMRNSLLGQSQEGKFQAAPVQEPALWRGSRAALGAVGLKWMCKILAKVMDCLVGLGLLADRVG